MVTTPPALAGGVVTESRYSFCMITAVIMLSECWEYITEEGSQAGLVISAVEGTFQDDRWRDFTVEQIQAIIGILEGCIVGEPALELMKRLTEAGLDMYPFAPEECYGDEEISGVEKELINARGSLDEARRFEDEYASQVATFEERIEELEADLKELKSKKEKKQ